MNSFIFFNTLNLKLSQFLIEKIKWMLSNTNDKWLIRILFYSNFECYLIQKNTILNQFFNDNLS